MYAKMASHWLPSERMVRETISGASRDVAELAWLPLQDFALEAMYIDTVTYLPDDILVKLDRASMAFGLEGRVPYLDQRVVEFAWRLPLKMKIRRGCGKWILRQLLHRRVPSQLVQRSKMGFSIPLNSWLRTWLRDWAEGLLDPKRMQDEGFFDAALIRKKWEAHLHGHGAWEHHLWDVLMFQSWLDSQSERQLRPPSLAAV
jgi:asparagine synthase (glutamine-hydrolysing)